jgi:hypothetical protein
MPFAFNALLKLQQDWRIDLFLGELPNSEYSAHFSPNVRVRNIQRALTRKWYLKEAELALRFVNHFGYSAVLALGQVGVSVGNVFARLNRCPLIVFNDEFPSCFGYTRWADREAQGLRNASLIVTPDLNRVDQLRKEVHGLEGKLFVELLNVPLALEPDQIAPINWHQRLGLPDGSIPLLCAGGTGEHNQIPELLYSVQSWPEKYVLVLRGNNPVYGKQYRDQLSHLDLPDRIFWYFDPLTTEEFDSLVSYCAISFALYRDEGPNMREMGKASGKLLRSVTLGVPVIASRFPSLSFVESEKLGVLVHHPAEIRAAIDTILNASSIYKENCLSYKTKHFSCDGGWSCFERAFASIVRH